MNASAGPLAAAFAGLAGLDDDGVLAAPDAGWQVPPDDVDWLIATEQPEATEPLTAMASPDATEL
ncbi:MAG: hypothetical protein JO265_02715, partial [Acidimicrobiia bacterium]|nr:hypothetical protein [Acidimicrobiia bacterium]